MAKKSWILFGIIILLSGVISACNYPGVSNPNPQLSSQVLLETLVAEGLDNLKKTQLAGITPTETQAFPNTATAESLTPTMTPVNQPVDDLQTFYYLTQPGDTLLAIARRFDVTQDEILPISSLPADQFLAHSQWLKIPRRVEAPENWQRLLPDGELIRSPLSINFDTQAFIQQAGGYLSHYSETFKGEELNGYQVIERVSIESSISPQFLIALIEFRSGWVFGSPANKTQQDYPIGFQVPQQTGLYRELVMVATHLNAGYYGWRDGSLVELKFQDATLAHIPPKLNPGTAAVQHLFSKFYRRQAWEQALYGEGNFSELYTNMFGDPWGRADAYGPLVSEDLIQPTFELPFTPGERWSLTAGPHPSWKTGSPRGAVDFAPVTGEPACAISKAWVLAAAPGLVIRSERNAVTIDLDGDGHEETGWVILYYHIADFERIPAGTWVQTDDRIGHPSCEGGNSTGTHFHIARKYNGEWIAADGPLRMNLGGWLAYAAERNYYGEMRNGDQVAVASPVGPRTSIIVRE